MKNLIAVLGTFLTCSGVFGQTYPQVTIKNINTPQNLANCNDTSIHYLDTVTFVGYVVTDGGLSEVQSSSIIGANGVRPFIWVNDTANNGEVVANSGLQIMGVNWSTNVATPGITTLNEGEVVEITGVVSMFSGGTMLQPLNNNSLNLLAVPPITNITPKTVPLGDLNDQNQVNQISTGQAWEGAYITINDVTVTSVNTFGFGSGQRVTFKVADQQGNTMEVHDFFLAQRLPTWNTNNPTSPATTGSFTPPVVGTYYDSISGVIEHSGNGCLGGFGTGYRIHPFKPGNYTIGLAPPVISQVAVTPKIPTSADPIILNADITDTDGTIDTAQIFWSLNSSAPLSNFNISNLTHTTGANYQFAFNAQPDGTNIYYYLRIVDNDGQVSFFSKIQPAQQDTGLSIIYVRDHGLSIMDVQTPVANSDASPFESEEVTVKGYVSAAGAGCDLSYFYIQDTSAGEYAGLALRGNLGLFSLNRGELVEVKGVIDETFSFTTMVVDSIAILNDYHTVAPVVLNPSDSAGFYELEKYESMLISYQNPNGDSIVVSNSDLGFGEYSIATGFNSGPYKTRRVLAGRSSGLNAQSSLHFQLVSDSAYSTTDGIMAFPPVLTQQGQYMDALTGILWYSFGDFKLTPRNNFDAVNPSFNLNKSRCIPGYFTVDWKVACESYTWNNGVTYTASTTAPTDTFVSSGGQDSIVVLYLKIFNPAYGIDSVRTCGSYTWVDGITYTVSTTNPVDTLSNAAGCDSVVNLHLTIINHLSGVDSVTACKSYTWTDGITYTRSTTTPTDTFIVGNCDSIVSLHLSIDTIDVSVSRTNMDLTANTQAAGYQWLDCDNNYQMIGGATAQTYTATGNGSYAVEITQKSCVDTSDCININDFSTGDYKNPRLEIYPNPNDGTFYIKANDSAELEILDARGRLVDTRNIQGDEPVSMRLNKPAGIYILRVRSEGFVRQYKLSIQ